MTRSLHAPDACTASAQHRLGVVTVIASESSRYQGSAIPRRAGEDRGNVWTPAVTGLSSGVPFPRSVPSDPHSSRESRGSRGQPRKGPRCRSQSAEGESHLSLLKKRTVGLSKEPGLPGGFRKCHFSPFKDVGSCPLSQQGSAAPGRPASVDRRDQPASSGKRPESLSTLTPGGGAGP